MFRLHEQTRRWLCRIGFLVLCLAPTLLVGAAAVRFRSASYLEARREEWAAVLSDKLGLDVQIAGLSYPLWNTALLEQVVLRDPETHEEVVRTRYVEVVFDEGRWQIIAGQPEINATALPLLVELLNYRLLKGQSLQLAPLAFEARELTLHGPSVAQTFQHVRAELLTTETGKRADVKFQIAGVESKVPLQLTIDRQRSSGGAKTICRLDTHDALLPCGSLLPLGPWLEQLGAEATFQGAATQEQTTAGATTDIAGTFRDVDLDRLIAAEFPHHKLTGWADVQLARLKLAGGKIVEMNGTLQTRRGGVISRTLLVAAQEQLDLKPAAPPKLHDDSLVRYSHLAFGFQLDHEGLSLSGDTGVIMASAAAGTLLVEPQRTVMPAVCIMKAFSPESDLQVPATAAARTLFDLLPLPALISPERDARPSATIRLSPVRPKK